MQKTVTHAAAPITTVFVPPSDTNRVWTIKSNGSWYLSSPVGYTTTKRLGLDGKQYRLTGGYTNGNRVLTILNPTTVLRSVSATTNPVPLYTGKVILSWDGWFTCGRTNIATTGNGSVSIANRGVTNFVAITGTSITLSNLTESDTYIFSLLPVCNTPQFISYTVPRL